MSVRRTALALVLLISGCTRQAARVKSAATSETQPAVAAMAQDGHPKDPPRRGDSQATVSSPAAAAAAEKPAPQPKAAAAGPSAPVAQRPADPAPVHHPVVNLTIFQFSVPAGAISRSSEFWKHVDEHAVDAYTYDILYKNGLRVGRAPLAEWSYFQEILDRYPRQAKPALFATTSARDFDLPMELNIPEQRIFDFDAQNFLNIRSYDASDNVFAIRFEAAPRKPGDVRVTLCPKIITQRTHYVPRGDLDVDEWELVRPERKLNLSLRTDVALDQILILAPSPEAAAPMSVGHSFMMHEDNAQEMEEVLMLIPQPMRLPERAANKAPAAAAAKAE